MCQADDSGNGNSRALALDLARAEADLYFKHGDAQDSKAGIVLGFSAALVALGGGQDPNVVEQLGRLLAFLSGLLAFWAIFPRDFAVVSAHYWREQIDSGGEKVRRRVTRDYLAAASKNKAATDDKAVPLKASMIVLFISILAFALPAAYAFWPVVGE